MKFLIDAQLPRRLVYLLREHGHDAIHTLDLQSGNRTSDSEINELAGIEQRIVVTKDADFVNSFHLSGEPYKLLLVSTGNISNAALEAILVTNLSAIEAVFDSNAFVELTRTILIIHS